MATIKVSALTDKPTLTGSEQILINDGGTSKRATVTAVRTGSYTLPEATSTVRGGVELFNDTDQSVAATAVSTTAARTYGLQLNSDGQGVINVPWADTDTTYSAATASALGLVKIEDDAEQTVAANTVSTTASRTYGIQLNSGDQAVVNVPWTDTAYTLPEATTTVRGGLELFSDTDQSVAATAVSTTASRTYGLQLNSDGQGVINVPWEAGGGATGGGSDEIFYENGQTVTTNYELTANTNAMTAGPITIDTGIAVTVPTGATWVIV